MAYTLLDYRTSVRSKLDDDTYEQAVVDEAINWYIADVCNRIHIRRMEASEDLFISQNDTDVEFPDDMQTLINLSVTSPSPARAIMKNYVQYNQFIQDNADFQNVAARSVANLDWTDFANGMRLGAPATADTTVFCEYMRYPELMVEDTDECELPDVYQKMIVIGALAEVMERNEDYEEAAVERKKLTGDGNRPGLEDTFFKREARGMVKTGPNVLGRGRRRSYRADRDF